MADFAAALRVVRRVGHAQRLPVDVAGDGRRTKCARRQLLGHQQRRVEPRLQPTLGGQVTVAAQQADDGRKRHRNRCAQGNDVDQHRK